MLLISVLSEMYESLCLLIFVLLNAIGIDDGHFFFFADSMCSFTCFELLFLISFVFVFE